MIEATEGMLHWNYFIALEQDMERVSRYIEFAPRNFIVYSIELAHLLFAAASEVDIVCKLLCAELSPGSHPRNINEYRSILATDELSIHEEKVFIPRYGLTLAPWENWGERVNLVNPNWWTSYNRVKHERNAFFQEATLQNALNALAGLLVVTFYYYRSISSKQQPAKLLNQETTLRLTPNSTLLSLRQDYYFQPFVG